VRSVIAVVLATAALSATTNDAQSAHAKFYLIQHGKPAPGARISLSNNELSAWIRDESAYWASYGATNLRFDLAPGAATVYADIDFLRARKAATGEAPGWLLRNLFSGKKPVVVNARFASANGKGKVDVDRVEVNGVAVEGAALDMLIQDYVKPNFPEAKVAEWFPLEFRVNRFTVSPGGVTVVIGK